MAQDISSSTTTPTKICVLNTYCNGADGQKTKIRKLAQELFPEPVAKFLWLRLPFYIVAFEILCSSLSNIITTRIRLEDVQKQKRCDSSRPLAAASDQECLELAHVVPNSKSSMTNVRFHATYTSKRRPQYLDAITGGFLQSDPSCMPSMACFRASWGHWLRNLRFVDQYSSRARYTQL